MTVRNEEGDFRHVRMLAFFRFFVFSVSQAVVVRCGDSIPV